MPSIRACGANRNQRGSMRIDVTPQAPAITAAAPDHCRCSHARAATLPGDGAVALLFANDVFGGGAQLRWRRGAQRQQQRPHCNRTTRPHAPEPDGIVWPRDRARINGPELLLRKRQGKGLQLEIAGPGFGWERECTAWRVAACATARMRPCSRAGAATASTFVTRRASSRRHSRGTQRGAPPSGAGHSHQPP